MGGLRKPQVADFRVVNQEEIAVLLEVPDPRLDERAQLLADACRGLDFSPRVVVQRSDPLHQRCHVNVPFGPEVQVQGALRNPRALGHLIHRRLAKPSFGKDFAGCVEDLRSEEFGHNRLLGLGHWNLVGKGMTTQSFYWMMIQSGGMQIPAPRPSRGGNARSRAAESAINAR